MASDSGDGTGDPGVAVDPEPVDGGKTPGGVVTYELNDEGVLVNQETGAEYTPGPESPSETLPDWLWAQHNATAPQEVES